MIQGKQTFIFVNKTVGVTKEGVRYVAFDVLEKKNKNKYSFVAKNPDLITRLENTKFVDFQDVVMYFDFNKVFNPQTRFSNWQCELIDVGNATNTNNH